MAESAPLRLGQLSMLAGVARKKDPIVIQDLYTALQVNHSVSIEQLSDVFQRILSDIPETRLWISRKDGHFVQSIADAAYYGFTVQYTGSYEVTENIAQSILDRRSKRINSYIDSPLCHAHAIVNPNGILFLLGVSHLIIDGGGLRNVEVHLHNLLGKKSESTKPPDRPDFLEYCANEFVRLAAKETQHASMFWDEYMDQYTSVFPKDMLRVSQQPNAMLSRTSMSASERQILEANFFRHRLTLFSGLTTLYAHCLMKTLGIADVAIRSVASSRPLNDRTSGGIYTDAFAMRFTKAAAVEEGSNFLKSAAISINAAFVNRHTFRMWETGHGVSNTSDFIVIQNNKAGEVSDEFRDIITVPKLRKSQLNMNEACLMKIRPSVTELDFSFQLNRNLITDDCAENFIFQFREAIDRVLLDGRNATKSPWLVH